MTASLGPAAQAREVGVRFGSRQALTGVSFTLMPGIVGLVGVNGAGKSTLMRLLGTTLVPTAGGLEVFGLDPARDLRTVRRRLGYMPQSLELPAQLRVCDFLAHAAWLRGFSRRVRPQLIENALTATDLLDRRASRIGSLSGGMRRRVLLAQAVMGDPDLLLLDEPTAGLDPEQRIRVRDLISRAAGSRTVVVSSHLMEDLVPIAERMLMLHEGRVAFDGTINDLAAIGAGHLAQGSSVSVYEAAFLSLCSARVSL